MSTEVPGASGTGGDHQTQVYVNEDSGEVVTLRVDTRTPPGSPRLPRAHPRRPHGFLQSMGFLMLPSSPALGSSLDFDAVLREAVRASADFHEAQRRRRRMPSIPNNAPRAVKLERVHRCWDPVDPKVVGADAACGMCFEPLGRKRTGFQSPCCKLYCCTRCAAQFARFPHGGVCEACTAAARAAGGKSHVPLGGPPGPAPCRCKYLCPQRCNPEDGMRSLKVELEAQAALEAARAAARAARATRKRGRTGCGTGRKRARI